MLTKEYLPNHRGCRVTFTLPVADSVRIVHLVGDFNHWDETATPMGRCAGSLMTVVLTLNCGQEYQFRYLIDEGEWHNDWAADKYVVNPFGGDNSVVIT